MNIYNNYRISENRLSLFHFEISTTYKVLVHLYHWIIQLHSSNIIIEILPAKSNVNRNTAWEQTLSRVVPHCCRVSLTYRVKSAHKVKLTDKQLLQWMFPILLVMLIYLSTWTLSAPPIAVQITDNYGLLFKQCLFNWWDHSLAIGESSLVKTNEHYLHVRLSII